MQLALKHLVTPDPTTAATNGEISLKISTGQSVVLENVSWQTYEKLLIELAECSSLRLAYDRGILEIMAPLPEHEYFKEAIGDLVKDLADELDVNYETLGSTTWKRQDLLAGVEADNCFYVQNELLIRGKLDFDLTRDPPPDLALEIDLTSKSLDRFPLYARLRVPEIWRYDKGQIKIYQLQGEAYVETNTSLAFPNFPVQEIIPFIQQNRALGKKDLRRAFRSWVQQRINV
jgi:Uma2 family endonuclease